MRQAHPSWQIHLPSDESPDSKNPQKKFRSRQPDEYNSDVPQLEELVFLRKELIEHLLQLYKRGNSEAPIVLVEHRDGDVECFTNEGMRRTLKDILGEELFEKLVLIVTFDAQKPFFMPVGCDKDRIFILGGSTSFTDDTFGKKFVTGLCRPLVEEISRNARLRALGVCFGYQGLLEAFGQSKRLPIVTERSRLMFGYYPVHFENNDQEPWMGPLVSEMPRQLCFTRSGYPRLRHETLMFADIEEITTLARLDLSFIISTDPMNQPMKIDRSTPKRHRHADAMVSMFKGKILATAFHPEMKPETAHFAPLVKYVEAIESGQLMNAVPPEVAIQLDGTNYPKPVADVMFIGMLGKWAKELAEG